jgi:Domain of unknown function (DUF4470)
MLSVSVYFPTFHTKFKMLKPAHIEPLSYFYAAGNTPAVCLTQSVAPGQDATVLLLGCGDARNILFTTYSRSALGKPN